MSEMQRSAAQLGRAAGRQPWLETLARAGYAASGLVHLLIGWIAIRLALGGGGGEADQGGAFEALRSAPLGGVLLWACFVGLAALALWQVVEAAVGDPETGERLKAAGKGAAYAAFAATAFTVASGGGADSGRQTAQATGTLMQLPLGRLLVGIAGLVVLGIAGYHAYKGETRKFLEDLRGTGGGDLGRGIELAGILGYVAKGVALAVVGGLLLLAAARGDSGESTGLDGALRALAEQPLGSVLLGLVALGLVLYGLYSFARARLARM